MLQTYAWAAHDGWDAALREHGAVLLSGVPCDADNAALRALGARLGTPSLQGLPHRSGLVETHGVQRVEALGAAPLDQFDQPLLSGHYAAFPLHSDEAFLARPARWVMLHCWRRDEDGGGACLLADRDDAWRAADAATRDALRTLPLPYPHAASTAISDDGLLRYNRRECEGAARRQQRPLDCAWLDRFDALFAGVARTVALAPGDLLVVDNRRMLHGRTAFAPESRRLLKRLRIA